MRYNDNPIQYDNNEQEEILINFIFKLTNAGLEPLITNDYSSWSFPHECATSLKDDLPLDKPHEILELQIQKSFLNSQSFCYWDDENPVEDVEGLLVIDIKKRDKNGAEVINRTINLPVSYGFICRRHMNNMWFFYDISTEYEYKSDNNFKYSYTTHLNEYDISIPTDSPRQVIVLSTPDRVRRMDRLLFKMNP